MARAASTGVSIAAGLALGGIADAQQGPAGGAGEGSGQPDRTGAGEMQRQHGGSAAGLSGQQDGQQVDQQINQQLQQFSQDAQNGADKLFVLRCALDNQFEQRLAQEAQQKV